MKEIIFGILKMNFKNELLNYNMIDCIALYEILIKFNIDLSYF